MRRRTIVTSLVSLILACASGCSTAPPLVSDAGTNDTDAQQPMGADAAAGAFRMESDAFEDGELIPAVHRCSGAPSPPLHWHGAPSATRSYAIVMRDLDFMNGFLHWVLYDIPASVDGLDAGVATGYEPAVPQGAKQASVLARGYFGPCSPSRINTYAFTIYALDVDVLPDVNEASPARDVVMNIEAHALAEATLQGRSGP